MNAATDRLEFAPPPQPGFFHGLVLALIAHLLLLLALTWGVNWNRDAQDVAAEAELWASVPQQAAPKEVVTAPPVVVAPPVAREEPKPVVREEPKPQPKPREADIAEEREKQRKQLEARREAEEERMEQQRRKAEAQRKEQEKKQQLAAEQRKKEEEQKRKEKLEEARIAKQREENLQRMQGMAAGTGSPSSQAAAARSSGPSASWAGRVQARVRPNIVFTDDVAGNPKADVEVRMAPDGTIVSRRLVKSSGVKSWDDAVLRALDKTEVLPRDTDGRVHSPVILEFKPRG